MKLKTCFDSLIFIHSTDHNNQMGYFNTNAIDNVESMSEMEHCIVNNKNITCIYYNITDRSYYIVSSIIVNYCSYYTVSSKYRIFNKFDNDLYKLQIPMAKSQLWNKSENS